MRLEHLSDPHALPFEEVLTRYRAAHSSGLSSLDVQDRLADFGPNELPAAEKTGVVIQFLRHLNDVLIYVLLGAAVLTAVLQHWIDTIVIVAVVVVNATVGFLQEGRAERALESIREMLSPSATVLRDDVWHSVPATGLVVGDFVRLRAGDKVPADLRLNEAQELTAEESALTGEALEDFRTVQQPHRLALCAWPDRSAATVHLCTAPAASCRLRAAQRRTDNSH
nr:cation-transporting P-type ATPase [Nesterenkonia haasae]